MVDRAWSGWGGKAEAIAQLGEDRGALPGPQVEVAAEQQRRLAGPLVSRNGGSHHVLRGQLGIVSGGVQVGDAESGRDPGQGHRPPLRRARVDRQLPPFDDLYVPVRLLLPRGA